MAALAALVPMVGRADTVPAPTPDTLLTTILDAIPAGSTVDGLLGTASKSAGTCVVQTYINRAVLTAEGGDKVSCGNAVVETKSTAELCDTLVGNCASAAPCVLPGSSCSNDVVLDPAPFTDDVRLYVTVSVQARSGYGWGIAPAGCHTSGSWMNCSISQDSPGGLLSLGPIVPVL